MLEMADKELDIVHQALTECYECDDCNLIIKKTIERIRNKNKPAEETLEKQVYMATRELRDLQLDLYVQQEKEKNEKQHNKNNR
jgi:predicted nucleic acid-binding protein